MTKKLSDLFNLPPDEEDGIFTNHDPDSPTPTLDDAQAITAEALSNLDKIEQALPQVRGLELADVEMDSLSDLAVASYKDLMDLGFQVDSRFSSEIFAVGSTMLGHAITAKTAKLNKKIKMIELQLKKAALDQKANEKGKEIDAIPVGQGQALDRNELLKILGTKPTEKDK